MGKSKRNYRRQRGNSHNKQLSQKSLTNASTQSQPDPFLPPIKGNFKMECYYALQGIHNYQWHDQQLIECVNDQEKHNERQKWRTILGEILPASFRIGKGNVPAYYKDKLVEELQSLMKEASEYKYEVEDETVNGTNDEIDDKQVVAPTGLTVSSVPVEDRRRGPLNESNVQIQTLQFLPHAYQLGLDRATIRKNPALQKLHHWLKQTSAQGHVTRQETVSMIPPVLLNVQCNDTVLDMCAAPGSKTSQLLEDLSSNNINHPPPSGQTSPHITTAASTYGGLLVANDASASRARMLASQLRRILHHHPVAVITGSPAQFFPSTITQFDKILCDVPCSGDGTTRKNIGVWKNWSSQGALALHRLQIQIAVKGAMELLRVNGILCYSTCSYNPIENEAVVAHLLRQSQGALELVDCGPLSGFRTRPGMSTWKVLCEEQSLREVKNEQKKKNPKMMERRKEYENKNNIESNGTDGTDEILIENKETDLNNATDKVDANVIAEEIEESEDENLDEDEKNEELPPKLELGQFEPASMEEPFLLELATTANLNYYPTMEDVPQKLRGSIGRSVFPPSSEEAASFHLERCIRCLAHDNDTGGFFVALLRKTAPMTKADRRHETTEPDKKKIKVDSDRPDDDSAAQEGANDAENESEALLDNVEALEGLDDDNKPIRGQVKGNLLKGQESVGKDDFIPISDEIMLPLIEYYGLTNGFEKELYMARAGGESKAIYYIAKPIKHLFDLGLQKRINIVNTGLKGFQRNRRKGDESDTGEAYRVCQEGVAFLHPYMTKRKIVVGPSDFKKCLGGNGKTIHLSEFSDDFSEQVKTLTVGSFVAVLNAFEDSMTDKLAATMWKCRGDSVDGLVAKIEIDEMLSRIEVLERKE